MAHTASLSQLQIPKWALANGFRFDQSGLLVQVRQAYLQVMRGDVTVDDVAMVPLA